MSANPFYMAQNLATDASELSPEAVLVRETLVREGLETPMIEGRLNSRQKYERIRLLMTDVMETLGLDLAEPEQPGGAWSLPDVVIYPTGGGTGVLGMWKVFSELEDLGERTLKNVPDPVRCWAVKT